MKVFCFTMHHYFPVWVRHNRFIFSKSVRQMIQTEWKFGSSVVILSSHITDDAASLNCVSLHMSTFVCRERQPRCQHRMTRLWHRLVASPLQKLVLQERCYQLQTMSLHKRSCFMHLPMGNNPLYFPSPKPSTITISTDGQ